jgi:hypothetical protein
LLRWVAVWPVGFGDRDTFFDRAQLLQQVDQRKLVTPVDAWLRLHGKPAFLHYGPPSIVSANPAPMLTRLQTDGGRWVLKPCAGSFGWVEGFRLGPPAATTDGVRLRVSRRG